MAVGERFLDLVGLEGGLRFVVTVLDGRFEVGRTDGDAAAATLAGTLGRDGYADVCGLDELD